MHTLFASVARSPRSPRPRSAALATLPVLVLVGCSGTAEIPPPALNPERTAAAALAQYDANKDGRLDADELKHCPALLSCLKKLDANGDGALSADEIAGWLTKIQEHQSGLFGLAPRFTLDNAPLAGADITFEPESFFGGSVRRATAVTDETGVARLKADGLPLPGVQPGLYRVIVSKKNPAGEETIPARYNSGTTLGQAVSPDLFGRDGGKLGFRLSSR